MIVYGRRFVHVGELWFDEEPSGHKVDVLRYCQRSQPVPNARCLDKWSIQVDLTVDEGRLLAGFKKEARYEVRRALSKDAVVFAVCDGRDPAVVAEFCDQLDRFARGKGVPPADREHLNLYAEASMLLLTRVRSPADEDLVWHSYLLCGQCVRLLHSASLFRESSDSGFRNLVGRANRFLHWQDMLYFKKQGHTIYDFGGWYPGKTDRMKLGINEFKEQFGGQIVHQYDCLVGVSIKGKLALGWRRILSRLQP